MASLEELTTGDLQALARRHLWMHFTNMGAYDEAHEVPIVVRGEGCHVYDQHGRRYFDGLSALFCVNVGHGRAELAQAGATRRVSSGSSPTGPTRTRPRSTSPPGSPDSRRATSTACSSPRAAPRRWSRR